MHPNKFSVRSRFRSGTFQSLIYRKNGKAMLVLAQALAAAVLAWCLLNIGFWMEDSYSLREMAKSYEESELFFRQVDTILQHKLRAQDNNALFEENGEFNGNIEIDIQSYGKDVTAVQDMNTTYLLSDLLEFQKNGGQRALQKAIEQAQSDQEHPNAGEALAAKADTLETIHPVTGISLAECSQWYADASGFVMSMYQRLSQVSEDLSARYREYSEVQQDSWEAEAPSNLLYYIENTATGARYTNFSENSFEAAKASLAKAEEFTPLYAGERSFNIMLAEPERVLNDAAEQWFLNERFVNTNEKVLLAVNMEYPVSDELKTYNDYFANREEIVWGSLFGAVLGMLILLGALALQIAGSGLREGHLATRLHPIDSIPTELAAAIYLIAGVVIWLLLRRRLPDPEEILYGARLLWSIVIAGIWLFFLSACLTFVRRLRAHKLWRNSITRMLLHTWRRVTSARAASGQLLIAYVVVIVLNFLFLLLFGKGGILPLLVVDMVVLLFLLRDMAGKQSVWEGIHQISKGDLTFKIDTTTLTGESYEMARAVNEMGDGLQKAVDAIIKNERLKAELITNVSHDLKTPLTSIVNYVDLLKRENLEGERVQHYIEVLEQKSQRLKQLTEDLVEVSKISSGNIELHMMRIQVQSMLDQAYGEFEERFEEKKLQPVWKLQRTPVFIMADGRQFWRVLENLLGNICKYAKEDTPVQIGLDAENGMVRITIENISRERLTVPAEELMGRFVRGDRSRNTEGSGLGLSIAQSLTELQGGSFALRIEEERFAAVLTFPEAAKEQEKERAKTEADREI